MPSRNVGVLVEILDALGHLIRQPEAAFARLQEHFKTKLLVVAGDIELVQQQATTLRLQISERKRPRSSTTSASRWRPLHRDHGGGDQHLYPGRFIEP